MANGKKSSAAVSQVATEGGLPSKFNWETLLTSAKLPKLVKGLQGSLSRLEHGYHSALYSRLAAVAALAGHYRKNPLDWKQFCDHEAWKEAKKNRPTPGDAEKALGFVMRFSFGFDRKSSQAASKYKQAIEPLLGNNSPVGLPDAIEKAGGIVALLSRTATMEIGDDAEHVDEPDHQGSDDLLNDKAASSLGVTKTPARVHLPTGGTPPKGPSKAPGSGKRPNKQPAEDDEDSDPPRLEVDIDLGESVRDFRKLKAGTKLRLSVQVLKATSTQVDLMLLHYRSEPK